MRKDTHSVEEMFVAAHELLPQLIESHTVLLHGELGAGKTTFTQGVARALGVERPVKSPTYTLVNIHPVTHPEIDRLVHVDLYRIAHVDTQELKQIGLDELLEDPKALVIVEWPERLVDSVEGLDLFLTVDGNTHTIQTKTAR